MRRSVKQVLQGLIGAAAVAMLALSPSQAAEKKDFKLAWSIYVGWMPWGYATESGIVKKWADKYGINIEVKQFNDYIESINQYTAGAFDVFGDKDNVKFRWDSTYMSQAAEGKL